MELEYETRDENGNDFVKKVPIKEYPTENVDFKCRICGKDCKKGTKIKKIVSADFTDWAFVGDYVCVECSRLFSLRFYSYIVNPDGIKLINIRQMKDELLKEQKTPFRFIITTSKKKQLFYKSVLNENNRYFAVNLETEQIFTTHERMKILFGFVENLLALGAGKKAMADGEIPFGVIQKTGYRPLRFLSDELKRREIQIPLFCGQKPDITEEQALCNLDLILTANSTEKLL